MTSKRYIVDYDSKSHAVESKNSGSFSIRIRAAERHLVRSPSGRETLCKQISLGEIYDAIASEIPHAFLAGEEVCIGFVANVLSKANMISWIQQRILPKICRDAINMSRNLEETGEEGFLVEAEVEVIKEISLEGFYDFNDYDSVGRLIPTEPDCTICLEELSSGGPKTIMKLRCAHNFHRDCLLTWLRRKHSCPTCRYDINSPPPRNDLPRMIIFSKEKLTRGGSSGFKFFPQINYLCNR
ncbi:unnamed protein product [Thlaspi arvense]|uniref:RING-type domain-containing protein n=1 Tax=Thlaspi arvense TaxID=13288 RepID=A0AAU9T7T4_THLAR|nr:unnamed protein product [Thlaspi arvense]